MSHHSHAVGMNRPEELENGLDGRRHEKDGQRKTSAVDVQCLTGVADLYIGLRWNLKEMTVMTPL